MAEFRSPKGSPILGTLERLAGRAEIVGIDPVTGEPEYEGSTTIFWDDARTVTRDNKLIFLDEAGDEWTFDQLTEIDEEGEDIADQRWPECEIWTMSGWQQEVLNGETRIGYVEWVIAKREEAALEAHRASYPATALPDVVSQAIAGQGGVS